VHREFEILVLFGRAEKLPWVFRFLNADEAVVPETYITYVSGRTLDLYFRSWGISFKECFLFTFINLLASIW
jgi:hypothetical protein